MSDIFGRYKQACALEPGMALSYNNLGAASIGAAPAHETALYYARALQIAPDLAIAHYGFGIALTAMGVVPGNRHHYVTAIALDPGLGVAYNNLAHEIKSEQELPQIPILYRRALRCDPANADYWANLGAALETSDLSAQAIGVLKAGLAAFPQKASIYNNLGAAVSGRPGLAEQARTAHERAIHLNPGYMSAYRNLLNLGAHAGDQEFRAALLAHAGQEATLPALERIELHFALGTLYDQEGDRESAFRHWARGNHLAREQAPYDEAATFRYFDGLKSLYSRSFIESFDGPADPSSRPVFVVGMPRSGSTLVEQILSAHPEVHGAGELRDASTLAARYGLSAPDLRPEQVTPAALRGFARDYLEVLRGRSPAASRVVDKMLHNFQFVGILHLAFPNAALIHITRSPIDSCMSNFSKRLGGGHSYAHDLGQLGRYYRAYRSLMDHWREALPAGRILEVRYEDVVENLEASARSLVDFVDLPWDARCLEFHGNRRNVRTASQFQVRRPLYREGIGRWSPYLPYLKPLIDELGPMYTS